MRQWNKETIEEQLKLHKKQNKDERYNYFAIEFNSLWYCWELEKYTINKQKQIDQLTNNWNELEEWLKELQKLYEGNEFQNNAKFCITVDQALGKMNEIKEKQNLQ